jgi:hypothetical protein
MLPYIPVFHFVSVMQSAGSARPINCPFLSLINDVYMPHHFCSRNTYLFAHNMQITTYILPFNKRLWPAFVIV